jgi:hypothetical protein
MNWAHFVFYHDNLPLLAVIIDDFHPFRPGGGPDEADSVLLVNSDAVLPFAVSCQCFKVIARRCPQRVEGGRSVELAQFALDRGAGLSESGDAYVAEYFVRVSASEGLYRHYRASLAVGTPPA